MILHAFRNRGATLLLALALFLTSHSFAAAPNVTATKDDGVPAATKLNPGNQINYTITIGNVTGTADATGVTLTDNTPNNTTDVGGSLVASPVGVDDTYPQTVIGNVSINSANIPYSVVSNDYLGLNPAATIDQVQAITTVVTNTITATTAQGGTVVMTVSGAGIGQFTYNPPAGYEGADTFTYRLSDNANATSAASNRTATVSLNISGMVWFINNAAGAGDGRLSSPFNTLSAFQAVNDGTGNHPAANDNIFIYESSTSYTGPVTLLNGQKLIGQDATATLAIITSLTPPSGSAPFPATSPGGTLVTLTSATNAIQIANTASATIRGLTIGNTTGTGIANAGAGFGTLTISDISKNGTGGALTLTSGTLNGTIDNLTTTSSTNAVSLTTVPGTLTITAGAISGATGADFLINGSNAVLTYGGTITNTAGRSIDIQSKTGGSATFTGAINDTGTGIFLDNNDLSAVATLTFRGGITSSTGSSPAFTATNGGIVNVCATNDCAAGAAVVNTLTTTTGVALNVANTTIGASGLTFRSISVTGNNTLPSSGIILTNTGTVGLKVTGNGGVCTSVTPTCTGGTIQGTGSHGVALTNVSNIEFNLFQIHNTGDHGIFGDGVNNFTLRDSYIFDFGDTAGGAVSEDAMHFESTNLANTAAGHGLTGTVIIQRDTIGPDSAFVLSPNPPVPENKGIVVRNHNDLNFTMTVTGSKFIQLSNDGIDAEASNDSDAGAGKGAGTINVDGSTADGVNTFSQINGRAVNFQQPIDSVVARTFDLTIKNNTFDHVGIGGRWLASGRGTMNARYNNNTMTFCYNDAIRSESDAVNAALTPHASVNATINGNTMGGGSIFISLHRGALSNIAFTNNTAIGGTAAASGGCAACTGVHTGINLRSDRGSALAIDITGNTGTADGSLAFAQSALDMQATTNGAGNSTICANVGGAGALKNTFTENPDTAGQQVISIDPVGGSTITIQGGPGGSPGTENFLIGQNTLNGTNKVAISTPAAVPSGVGVDCVTSTPLLFSDGGVEKAEKTQPVAATSASVPTVVAISAPARSSTTTVPATPVVQTSQSRFLSQSELDSIVAIAIERWKATGLNDDQLAALHTLKFEVANLPSVYLGEANGSHIRVSNSAAGNGWFIDARAESDALFAKDVSATRSYTDPAGAPAGRLDLLTTILHEMGHAIGLPDSYEEKDRDSLMYGFLTKGERRLPTRNQAMGAIPGSVSGTHFLSQPVVTVSTLPVGKSVIVKFAVTINATTAPSISNQGTVSGSNFSNVLTDDPNVGGSADPTVTQVEQPPVVSNISASTNEDVNLHFTAAMFDAGFADPNVGDTLQSVKITSLPSASAGVLKNGVNPVAVNDIIPRANLANLEFDPVADYNGPASFNWNASDGTLFANADATVNITVNAVNDAPTLDAIPDPAAILEDAGQQTVNLTGITAGPANEQSSQNLTVTAMSNNTALIPNPTVSYTSNNTTGSLSYTPVANANGSAIITVTVKDDGGTSPGTDTFVRTFTVNVTAVNDAPTLDPIPDPARIPHNSGQQTVNLTGISEGPANEVASQTLTVTALSNNTGLIPNPTVSYAPDAATGSLSYTPVSGQGGTAVITVRVQDSGDTNNGGANFIERIFTVTVGRPSTTTVGSAPNPSNQGEQVVFTATVSPTSPSVPTMTVTFTIDGGTPLVCDEAGGSVQNLDGSGMATCTTSSITAAGSPHTVRATYSGDSVFDGSFVEVVQTVNPCANPATVTNLNDAGSGSLRDALTTVCAGGTINFQAGLTGTITLTTGQLEIDKNVTITGPGTVGSVVITVSAGGSGRVFNVQSGKTASISGLGIANGSVANTDQGGLGGGVYNSGSLTLTDCVISNNHALNSNGGGGAIYNGGTLILISDSVNTNSAMFEGGAIRNDGTLSITNSSLFSNTAGSTGGAIQNGGSLTIYGSTLSGNTSTSDGGAIRNDGTPVSITNSTLSGNNATGAGADGGGILNAIGKTLTITNSTIVKNTAADEGGGINNGGTLTIKNSIVALNTATTAAPDLKGDANVDYSLLGDSTGSGTITGANNLSGDPKLNDLGNYGGPTSTHQPKIDSPVLDAGNNAFVTAPPFPMPFKDQRGYDRIVDSPDADATATVDMGSVEVNYSITAVSGSTPQSATVDTAFAIPLAAEVSESGNPIANVQVDWTAPTGAVPTGTFSGSNTASAMTNASGIATPGPFTANDRAGGPYTVSATAAGFTGSADYSLTNTPGAATHFSITAPANSTAGSPFTITVTALDADGNVDTNYTGTVTFTKTDSGAGSAVPTNYTFTGADAGVRMFSNGVTFVTAGTQTVTATDTVTSSITGSANVNVAPATATHLSVVAPAGATAGAAFSFSVTALDQFNNVDVNFVAPVHFTSTDGAASLPGDYTFTNSDAGSHMFNATLNTAGTQTITATNNNNNAVNGTSNNISVSAGPATHFAVSAPASTNAGTPFNFTVTALDSANNVATGYLGTAKFTSTDGQAVLPADYQFMAADNGTKTLSATLKTAGNQTITATDSVNAGINGTSLNILVNPGNATHYMLTAPAAVLPNNAFNFTVTALDQFNNTATGYLGTAHFTKSDAGAGSAVPTDYTFMAGDNGSHQFSATLVTSGSQSITATDTVTMSITGTANIQVGQPPAITSADHTTFKVGTAGTFTVTTTGFPTNASMSITEMGTLPMNVNFVNNNNGTATLSGTPAANTGGVYNITIKASNGINPDATQSFTLTVNQGPTITSADHTTFTQGVANSFTVTTTGFPTGPSMSITRTGTLPNGVNFVNNNDGTATLSGTPALGTGGTWPFTIGANNGVTATVNQNFTLTVLGPGPTPTPTATATATATATPTATATATATATPTATATATATPTATATATPTATPAQALNISTRLRVDTGDKVMIGGFIITGNVAKPVLLRGIGPSLASAGLPAASLLQDPVLELHGASGALITSNDNWKDSPQKNQIQGTIYEPSDDRESVIVATLPPAAYTVILKGANNTAGIGLVEVYDNNAAVDSEFGNISTRGFVQTGDEVMIGGFVLGGSGSPTDIAVRALGPSLSSAGLTNLLADPTLELHNSNGTIMISNDDWQSDPVSAAELTAHGLALPDSKESGIFTSLAPPGQFTAIVAGKNGGVGIALVEIYNVK